MPSPSHTASPARPLIVHGTDASYFTGKLEAYLRAKGIAYRLEPFGEASMRRCARHTGVVQVPQVECPDGSWLVDTTLIPYLEANAIAFAEGGTRVRYEVQGVTFEEPVKPYRVWCRDRLQRRLAGLESNQRGAVERALASGAVVARLATPSPKPVESIVGALPIDPTAQRRPVDSWWRRH